MGLSKRIVVLLTGSMLIASGLNGFLIPQGLMEGGALGISLIVHYVAGTQVGLTFFLISVPIFMLAWLIHRPFFFNAIHGMLFSAIVIDGVAPIRGIAAMMQAGPLTSALMGGILIGLGTGIMMRHGISIGGTDLLAQLIAKVMKVNSGVVILIFDIVIVIMGSLVIAGVSLLLSLITVLCVGLTISVIVAGNANVQPTMNR